MDEYGYPTEEELEKIRKWPVTDFNGLAEYLKSLWKWPDFVVLEANVLKISTG